MQRAAGFRNADGSLRGQPTHAASWGRVQWRRLRSGRGCGRGEGGVGYAVMGAAGVREDGCSVVMGQAARLRAERAGTAAAQRGHRRRGDGAGYKVAAAARRGGPGDRLAGQSAGDGCSAVRRQVAGHRCGQGGGGARCARGAAAGAAARCGAPGGSYGGYGGCCGVLRHSRRRLRRLRRAAAHAIACAVVAAAAAGAAARCGALGGSGGGYGGCCGVLRRSRRQLRQSAARCGAHNSG